jgi:hypothetical protein
MRKWVPALRERNQPVNYYPAVKVLFKRIVRKISGIFATPEIPQNRLQSKPDQLLKKRVSDRQANIDRNLKIQLDALDTLPSDEEAGALIESLHAYVRYLQQKGVKIIVLCLLDLSEIWSPND